MPSLGRAGHYSVTGAVTASALPERWAQGISRETSEIVLLARALLLGTITMWKNWSGTARRLLVGFGALVVIIGLSSWLTVAGLSRIHGTLVNTSREEENVRLALELASAVRDQYAHQAHTIIIGDRSHLLLYTDAAKHVLDLTRTLRTRAHAAPELAWIDDIDRASGELETIFRQRIVPAVVDGNVPFVRAEHARAQVLVSAIQDAAGHLVDHYEARIAAERAGADAVERRTRRGALVVLLGTPIVAALVMVVIGRAIAGPMERLRTGAARIGAGDLHTRIEVDSHDEFGILASQFNAMAGELASHQAQLVQSEKLAGIGRLAAGVAHEINNPLAVILGYTRLLRRKKGADLGEDLAVIEEETLRCKEIVEGLLDLSRPLCAGREPVDVRSEIETVISRLREGGQLEDVDVSLHGDATVPADASKLRQVLTNLVRNAGEAAGPGGNVWVEIRQEDGRVQVNVRDSGQGLDPRAQTQLFEPFFTTKPRGTGLGLAISRSIARAHGGDVSVSSPPGEGATFTLELPVAVAEVA